MFITGASVVGYLISDSASALNFASVQLQASSPILQIEAAWEQERTVTLQALGGDPKALAGLQVQRNVTNAALSNVIPVVNEEQRINPAQNGLTAEIRQLTGELPAMRQRIDKRQTSASEVDNYYTQLANLGLTVLQLSAPAAPDSAAAAEEITTLNLFQVPDLHSRAVGLASSWAARGVLSQPNRLVVAQLTGAYRYQLQALAAQLTPSEIAAYHHLQAGNAWHLATSGEDALAQRGKLTVPSADWLAAENTVSTGLLGLWDDSFRHSESAAVAAASQTLHRSILVGSVVLAVTLAAALATLILANWLVRRLRRLRSSTLELADVTLPSLVRRIGDGELVDVGAEVTLSGYGADEIGQVAEAFNTAQRTAVAAAAAEARTRAGISKVFLDIAHRSQLVVHRQLELLDVAEAKQSDPDHLELLFQLDHLATRARRNAENLLILGGGQPGRRWRRPAGLEDVVRSAVSETEQFARVRTARLPGVQVQGTVVGDLIHLLAELVDNATAFSPPDAAVTVRGNLVGRGAVVEVEDQGLGIEFAEREQLNQTLADPPDFQVMALSGQRQLGLFVVGQLARRHGIAVSLLESAYGGIKAIVLIPSDVVEAGATAGNNSLAGNNSFVMNGSGRHQRAQEVPAEVAPGPVPQPRSRQDADLRGRPAEEPPAEHVSPPPSWLDVPASADSPDSWDLPPGPRNPASRARAALPRRERMANLAPGLRLDADEAQGYAAPRRPQRSPEEARGSMSAFQRGTRLGRGFADEDKR